jgi:uncharacterized protein (DUF2141 family)
MKNATKILLGLFLFIAVTANAETRSNKLTVKISGLNSNDGQVVVLLYNSKKGFPMMPGKAFKRKITAVQDKAATVKFENLPSGQYAVFFYHDLDKNGKLNHNMVGKAKEDYGISNNPKGYGFDEAKFEVNSNKSIEIEVVK